MKSFKHSGKCIKIDAANIESNWLAQCWNIKTIPLFYVYNFSVYMYFR